MAENPAAVAAPLVDVVAPLFADAPPPKTPCSFNECLSGHRWAPIIAASACGGCGGPVLAVQKTNCPYCNEPTVRTVLRSDFVPRGAGIAKRCQGQEAQGETLDLELTRHEWQEVAAKPPSLFEDRRATERGEA